MDADKKHRPVIRALCLFIIIAAVITVLGCNALNEGSGVPTTARYKKVLIIGIDGTDPKIMGELMDEGLLPNFVRLKDMGGYSTLGTTIPVESPTQWSTIATGTNPGKHNVFGFIGRKPENYLPYLTISKQEGGITGSRFVSPVEGTPFWKITSDAGIPTTVIRWPVTFPPDEVNGRMFAGLGVPDISGFLNGYRFYTTENIDRTQEGGEKIVKVVNNNGVIDTHIIGPITGKNRERAKAPMQIRITGDGAVINVQGREYPVRAGGWSDWIRIEFEAGPLKKASGIAMAYLISVEPEFNMYLTSIQIDPEDPVVDFTYPGGYSKELVDEIGLYSTLGMPEDTKALTEGRISDEVFLEQCAMVDEEREKMFWYEFWRFDRGVFAFVFDTSDRIMHNFWDEDVLAEDAGDRLTINESVRAYYVEKDRFLGQVLDRIDNETALIVLSDHGFTGFRRAVSINTWLVENGYMTLTRDINEINEEDSGDLFKYVDWSSTRAYSLGFAGIYINLKGREGRGIVEENDRDELVTEIIGKLEGLTDPETGERVITRVYRGKDVYQGEFVEKNAPDIVIGFRPGYRMGWQNAIGGMTREVFSDNLKKWDGDHIVDPSHVPGVLFTNFRIEKQNPNQVDIAPTVLSMLGVDVPEEMEGKPLN